MQQERTTPSCDMTYGGVACPWFQPISDYTDALLGHVRPGGFGCNHPSGGSRLHRVRRTNDVWSVQLSNSHSAT